MKITAEFNSNEELLSFIGAFGANGITTLATETNNNLSQGIVNSTVVKENSTSKAQDTKKVTTKTETAAETAKKETTKTNTAPNDKPKETAKEGSKSEGEVQITKEMIRAKFMELIKAGKSKEAKEITKKYGASKLPELKEENYPAVYKEVEALL
ncbi:MULTISPECIES: hypothetical protein [Clostridium]|uniref:hypothetical protein n=1 Tax=Clostridium TaxID=1485 RepID=UPI00069EA42D|nr:MULTISPECIES: hypothetical protein [Clostridium]KOF56640.1 hypothetical protein AGR56_07880 [Clostridium sp. DMHC 10]MCD2348115.1 hypothetical protein [Clostridium guangxiense]